MPLFSPHFTNKLVAPIHNSTHSIMISARPETVSSSFCSRRFVSCTRGTVSYIIIPLHRFWPIHIRFILKLHFHVVTNMFKCLLFLSIWIWTVLKNRHIEGQVMQLYLLHDNFNANDSVLTFGLYTTSPHSFVCSRMFFFFILFCVTTYSHGPNRH